MSLTLADVERWDAGAVRGGVHGAGQARRQRRRGPRRPDQAAAGIATWQGSGGDAARASLDKLSAYLSGHGLEMARMASVTGEAADEIEPIKASLQRIKSDAQRDGFSIDMATGEVTPPRPDMVGDPIYALQQADLEARITELLTAANTADSELASAMTTAGEAPLTSRRYPMRCRPLCPTIRSSSTTSGSS